MRSLLALTLTAALSTSAFAQTDKAHAAHHPAGASAPGVASPGASAATPVQMDMQKKSMHAMHERMMAAKTPEERQALMADHMKTMRDGMAMMGQMKTPGDTTGKAMSPEMMSKRMDMMELMMQMMVDREAMKSPTTK